MLARLTPLALVTLVTFAAHTTAAHAQRLGRTPERQSISVAGQERTFVIRTPRDAPARGAKRPLVLALHGGGGNGLISEKMTGFTALVEREGIIVVYPEGTGRNPTRLLTWNAKHCCARAMEQNVDDVRFISTLLDTLIARYPVDPARIYITGMSNGAMMTHRLGIALARRVAAIAPVVGTLFGDEVRPAFPVPAIIFNGMADKSVPYAGGTSGGPARRAWQSDARPAREQGTFWAATNGCDATPTSTTRGTIVHTVYRCPAGREVELYALTDGGHAWPGGQSGSRRGDAPSPELNATDVMWTFFKAHARN